MNDKEGTKSDDSLPRSGERSIKFGERGEWEVDELSVGERRGLQKAERYG